VINNVLQKKNKSVSKHVTQTEETDITKPTVVVPCNKYKPVFVTKKQIQFLIPLPMMGKGTNVKSRLKLH